MNENLLKIFEKEKSKFNDVKEKEKILGILLYSFRISFISLIQSEKTKYFYTNIVLLKDNELLNFLKESFVPGFDKILNSESFDQNDFDQNLSSNKKILYLTLKFIFYSHLFYSYNQELISEDNIKNFTINKNQTLLQTLITIWNVLEKELNNNQISKIEIFLNLIIKYLPIYLELYLTEQHKNDNEKRKFVNKFNDFIEKCLKNYPEYQKYYIDYSMKYIIQEYNYPLRYKEEIFPYMKYFVVNGKPNIIDIKKQLKNNNFFLLNAIYNNNNYYFNYLRNFKNYNLIVYNIIKYLSYSSYYEEINSNKIKDLNYIKGKTLLLDLLSINENDKNIKEIMKINISELNDKIKQHYKNYIKHQNQILLMSIRYENCFSRTFRKMYIQDCLTDENINFNLSDFSKHTFYNSIYSKFISRKSFDRNKKVYYYDYQKFDIDIKHLEEELFSILFYRKNIFDNDKINSIIFRYDGLNKKNNVDNTYIIRNFLQKYKQEKMDNKILEQFNGIIGRSDKDKYKIIFKEQKTEIEKDNYKNEIEIKEKEDSKNKILEKINNIKTLREKDNQISKKIDELNLNLNELNKKLEELKSKEQNEETKKSNI